MNQTHDHRAQSTIEEAKKLVIDSIAETMDLYGVTRSVGTLYGTMYFEEDMSLDEMREELGMSKPSMSSGVKKLQEFNMVKNTFRKGSRKHTFIAEKDFFRFFKNFFSKKWEREVVINLEAVQRAQAKLQSVMDSKDVSDDIKQQAFIIFDQLEESKTYYHWLKKLVKVIQTDEIFKYVPIDEKEHV
ncbi:choline uptake/conversion transcriptional regulator CudC [Bacillus songklensis]|uniref:HTH-type transcriptional regulator n=1 Tax=Bacillus songklensis TaxID=1069116 RepID=A0ABV8B983_9BACI